nr:immunoglobulin heavy chain junction region [Macaca mulatta]
CARDDMGSGFDFW